MLSRAGRPFPSPLVGPQGERVDRRRAARRVRGYLSNSLACGENPSSGASRHLLPQGEKEENNYSTTGLSETSQSLPLKTWMNSVFIGV